MKKGEIKNKVGLGGLRLSLLEEQLDQESSRYRQQ